MFGSLVRREREANVTPRLEAQGSLRVTARFLLDTDSVSFALRGQGRVAQRIVECRPSELAISSITLAELKYGAERRSSRKLHHLIDVFTGDVAVLPFDEASAASFGKLASELVARGTPIGDFDTLIAAHAIQLGLILVTNDLQDCGGTARPMKCRAAAPQASRDSASVKSAGPCVGGGGRRYRRPMKARCGGWLAREGSNRSRVRPQLVPSVTSCRRSCRRRRRALG